MTAGNPPPSARALLDRWAPDPPCFAREVLGFDPWHRQAEVMRAVATHDHVACRSGHKIGKSRLDAALALWWVCTRPRARVVFTAPTGHQVANILWPELRDLYLKARCPLGGRLYETYDKGLKFPDGREVFGLTTRENEAFGGLSGANLLFIVDEASGFPEVLFDAVFGNMSGGGKVLLTGNPTRTAGTFYDAFHERRDAWHTLHVASTEGPNFRGGSIPGLATPAFLEWAAKQWGRGTPAWEIRIEGNYPRGATNTVIPLGVAEEAAARWETTKAEGPLCFGVDVGRFGDDPSVIFPRRGAKALAPTVVRKADGTAVAVAVLQQARRLRTAADGRPRVKVDVIGVGASVYDALRLQILVDGQITYHPAKEVDVVAVDVAAKANDPESYANRRAECWFTLGAWLAGGGAFPPDPTTEGELVAPTYSFDGQGRYVLEAKDRIKERLGRSPDHAEALMLAVVEARGYASKLEAAMARVMP